MTPIFPAGAAGAGLLALRVSVALSLLALVGGYGLAADWRHAIAILAALAVCAGVQTRLVAGLSLSIPLYGVFVSGPSTLLLVHAASAFALTMIGPGGYSIDAHFFGRRKIDIAGRRPPAE